MENEIYLCGLSYITGESRDIFDLDVPEEKIPLIQDLSENGLAQFRKSQMDLEEFFIASISRTISIYGEYRPNIDFVILCTMSPERVSHKLLYNISQKCGLESSPIVTVSHNGCANIMPALSFARSLIRNKKISNVLIATADKCDADLSRLTYRNFTILSDSAASCIVSSSPDQAEYQLHSVSHVADYSLCNMDIALSEKRLFLTTVSGVKNSFESAMHDTSIDQKQISAVLMSNTRADSMRLFGRYCGIGQSLIYLGSLEDKAHCYSSDFIINIIESKNWRMNQRIVGSDLFAVMGLGPYSWGTAIISQL